jgi:putative membrane protein
MKTSFILILSIALLFSCKSGTNNTSNTDGADAEVVGMDDNNTWDQDKIKEFADEAALGGMMEVELGKVAQNKAMSQQVRDFGKMKEKDHSEANNKLKTALESVNLNVPESMDQEHQDKVADLNKKAGKEFDKDYIDNIVQAHKDDIDEFEEAQKNLPDGELRIWVENTLPVLRQHLIQAETIQEQLKN